MEIPSRPSHRDDFEIAIVCALPVEFDAVTLIFDEFWDKTGDRYRRAGGDQNTYTTGRIKGHNVVLALLPNMGKTSAAGTAASLRSSYQRLRLTILVGICGGVPRPRDGNEIILGDVVIGKHIIQYDLGRQYPGRFAMKDPVISSPNRDIRSFLGTFETEHGLERLKQDAVQILGQLQHNADTKGRLTRYEYPGSNRDTLFAPTYIHRHREQLGCNCSEASACEAATMSSCDELQCDARYLLSRQRLQKQQHQDSIITPEIRLGNVGSADTVMKSAEDRDRISRNHDLLAFEMEGAGLWDEIPSIVVKGVCDYADSHKNKTWQPFAAATAASTAKALLGLYHKTDRLTDRHNDSARREFLRRLRTSPFEERKNRNPRRADGTCEWFTAHNLFQNWQKETSALLWVSADPGCGKSVLARYLVDDVFPSNDAWTTCYFFFKDDFEDQKVLEGALCCILHQLFVQKPALLSDEILDDFGEEGDQFFTSFQRLWSILIKASSNQNHGEIICVLDALDECVAQTPLIKALTELYRKGRESSKLKFLVTSRPYLRIQREFRNLEESQPTIHLSGENQEEVDKIAQEITITIKQRTEELGQKLQLGMEEKKILLKEIATVKNRTYLWVYLVFAAIEDAVFLTRDNLRASVRDLPHTVEEAYEKILRKSHDSVKARKILQIIVAADRPLGLTEMAAVLAFDESYRCHKDLERDLLPPDILHSTIRETCGLFVVIQNSRIFLLHQTAREFLVRLSPSLSEMRSPSLEWQHSLDLPEAHGLISGICIRYLLLDDFEKPGSWRSSRESDSGYDFAFLDYAACHWAEHYRQAHNTLGTGLERLALQLCDTNSATCLCWLEVYGESRIQDPYFIDEFPTALLVASYFGLDNLVDIILRQNKRSASVRSASSQRTGLSWASEKGYDSIVQSLLDRVPKLKVILKDWTSNPTIVNQTDHLGKTPLWYAVANGHQHIVQHLLKKGAKVDIKDEHGLTPLTWAVHHGYNDIVVLLLKNGAREDPKTSHLEIKDRHGHTPLLKAVLNGNDTAIQLLLDRGANIEAADKSGCTALMRASSLGHDAVVRLLLDRGANIEAADKSGCTALMRASSSGHNIIVRLLLDRGANIEAADTSGWTALMRASSLGHDAVVRLLLDCGAQKH